MRGQKVMTAFLTVKLENVMKGHKLAFILKQNLRRDERFKTATEQRHKDKTLCHIQKWIHQNGKSLIHFSKCAKKLRKEMKVKVWRKHVCTIEKWRENMRQRSAKCWWANCGNKQRQSLICSYASDVSRICFDFIRNLDGNDSEAEQMGERTLTI